MELIEKNKSKNAHKGNKFLESLWETIGEFPRKDVNWNAEWEKHVEKKYG